MQSFGKLRASKRGVGSIIGATFLVLILMSGFAFYEAILNATDHYNSTVDTMSEADWNRGQERIVIDQIGVTGANRLNITAENDGSIQSHLIWLGIFNATANPQNQTYQALNDYVKPGDTCSIVSSFTVTLGNKYLVQIVTELGNTVESKFYPANYVSCALTLVTAPPTVYQGNNVTVLLTVTLNDAEVDSIQSLTANVSATPASSVQWMSNSSLSVTGLMRGTSAFFWWIYNATTVGTVVFNGTYNMAPLGVYVLTSLSVLPLSMGVAGPAGPPGFSTNATFVNLIKNYPFGGPPTTLTPNNLGASRCYVYPFEIDRNITVTAIYIRSNAAVSNCLLIGIYDSTGTRLYASDALSTVATGWIAVTGISVTLASGTYYFGTTNNGANSGTAAYTVTPRIGTAALPRWGYVSTAGGAMPASITPSSIIQSAGTSSSAGWMCYVLLSAVTS